jgi:hypothetical protein
MPLALLQSSSIIFSSTPLNDHEQEAFAVARSSYPMLLDVIQAVREAAANDREMLVTVADLINSGQVRLCGDFAGATIDLSATEDLAARGPRAQGCGWLAMPEPNVTDQQADGARV